MSENFPSNLKLSGANLRIGVVAARFNADYVATLIENVIDTLKENGAPEPTLVHTPGSNELPFAAHTLAHSQNFDALITLGLVMAGATKHHHVIGDSTAIALHQISIQNQIPIINGIIVVESKEQALARCQGPLNRGREFALAALEMSHFNKKWKTTNQK